MDFERSKIIVKLWVFLGKRPNLGLLLALLLIEFVLLLCGGVLVLLVLRHQIIHVGLSLCELHLVHALAGVPVKESLAPEHGCELLRDTLKELLDGGAVAHEGGGHLDRGIENNIKECAKRSLIFVSF